MANIPLKYIVSGADFWRYLFKEEVYKLEASLQGQAELIKGMYFEFYQRGLPPTIKDFPIFKEQFWNVIQLKKEGQSFLDINQKVVATEDSAFFIKYPLDEPYAHIPYIGNKLRNSNILYKEGSLTQVSVPAVSGNLNLESEYINEYNESVTVNSKTKKVNEIFFADSTAFTVSGDAIGGIFHNRDYFIQRLTTFNPDHSVRVESSIIFRKSKDPFKNTNLKVTFTTAGLHRIILFAPKVFLDYAELYKYFGVIVGIKSESSFEYRNFLEGLFYLYNSGPTVDGLNVSLNTAYGFPVADEIENVIKVVVEDEQFILRTDRKNEYFIRRKIVTKKDVNEFGEVTETTLVKPLLKLSSKSVYDPRIKTFRLNGNFADPEATPPTSGGYDVYFPVKKLEGFLDSLRIVDYLIEPKWWLKKISNALIQGLTDLPEELRKREFVIDYLFEKYLKHNTFGVFIDPDSLTNFSGIKDFFKILNDIKPTYKTYLLNEQQVKYFSEIDTTDIDATASVSSTIFIQTEHDWDAQVGVDLDFLEDGWVGDVGPIRLGMAIEQIGSAYDKVRNTIDLLSDVDSEGNPLPYSIYSVYDMGPGIGMMLGGDLPLGLTLDEGILDQVLPTVGVNVDDDIDMSDDGITTTIVITPFDAPTINDPTNITTSGFDANWTEVVEALSYLFYLATDSGFTAMVPGYNGLEVFAETLSVTGLSQGQAYYYRLKSKNGAILSGYSTTALILETVTYNALTNITDTSFTANWNAVSGATSYRLDVSTVSNFASFVSGYNNLNVGNVITYNVTGLDPETEYFYRIRAVS